MIPEAVILAGGLGSRLKSVIKDAPKPMALIQGRPFLEHLLCYLKTQCIKRVVISIGYKHHIIQNYFGDKFLGIDIRYVVEKIPLGTGGALKRVFESIESENYFILNGDTYFQVNLEKLLFQHQKNNADITLTLKRLNNFDRYGVVKTDKNGRVTSFEEKRKYKEGLIYGGVLLINSNIFKNFILPNKFSFEKEFLHRKIKNLMVYSYLSNSFFIDIGIPEDFRRAQMEIPMYQVNKFNQI